MLNFFLGKKISEINYKIIFYWNVKIYICQIVNKKYIKLNETEEVIIFENTNYILSQDYTCKDSCGCGANGFTCTFRQSYWSWVLPCKLLYSSHFLLWASSSETYRQYTRRLGRLSFSKIRIYFLGITPHLCTLF